MITSIHLLVHILDKKAVFNGRPFACDNLGKRSSPPVQSHYPSRICRETSRVKFDQSEEISWVPTASQNQFVRPFLASHIPATANVTSVLSEVSIAKKSVRELLVRMRDSDCFAPLGP